MSDTALGRYELVRALGAVADSPQAARIAAGALGLTAPSDAELTDVFVLNLPPYAAVYLGPDGALGGEGADRVAGFWRVLRIDPPTEPDHLSALLGLYASLGEAVAAARRPATRAVLDQTLATLFWEHLHPWLPSYLEAVTDVPAPALTRWAVLLRQVMAAEAARQPAMPTLPLALRSAPPGLDRGREAALREMTEAVTIPVCSGMILTRHRVAVGARQAGVGHRLGERRFTVRAMIEQDPDGTLAWLAAEAFRWQRRHRARGRTDATAAWWADRADRTGSFLRARVELAAPTHTAARVEDVMITQPKTYPASATVGDVRRLLQDEHVHAALLVEGGRLVAVVERSDLILRMDGELAATVGQLDGRVIWPDARLHAVWSEMRVTKRRRLAVIDRHGALMGLLCLKSNGRGFCSDADVRSRQADPRC